MKNVLIDLNIILDFLNKRKNHESSAKLVDLCVNKQINGFLCAHEFTALAYFLKKEWKNIKNIRYILNELCNIFTIIEINENIIKMSINSEIIDYEDAILDESAVQKKLSFIITNNIKDFKKSKTKAISIIEYLNILS